MRRASFLALPLAALFLAGCPAKPKDGECKSSEDCAAQEGYGKICIEGRCQECSKDTDCKAGFVCRSNKCTPKPECEKDADCGAGKSCQAGKCAAAAVQPKAECSADADCGEGKGCESGKCVAKAAAQTQEDACGKLEMVNFGFNEAVLTAEARSTLEKDAKCIQQKKPKSVTIAGHCDERGTTEYNLQLGQRRAEAVKKYLVNLGVSGKSLKTVSFGKERPLDPGHDEGAWAKNRRAELAP